MQISNLMTLIASALNSVLPQTIAVPSPRTSTLCRTLDIGDFPAFVSHGKLAV